MCSRGPKSAELVGDRGRDPDAKRLHRARAVAATERERLGGGSFGVVEQVGVRGDRSTQRPDVHDSVGDVNDERDRAGRA